MRSIASASRTKAACDKCVDRIQNQRHPRDAGHDEVTNHCLNMAVVSCVHALRGRRPRRRPLLQHGAALNQEFAPSSDR